MNTTNVSEYEAALARYADADNQLTALGDPYVAGRYSSIEAFVIAEGEWYAPGPKLPRRDPLRGKMNYCYQNAGQIAIARPDEYTYVEGVAFIEGLYYFPISHAWVVKRGAPGVAVEVTWDEPGGAYAGVALRHDQLTRLLLARETWGLFTDCRLPRPFSVAALAADFEAQLSKRRKRAKRKA